jgi:hypothetical protein
MHIIIIFLDGIGLGNDDPTINPFATIDAPTLHQLSGGNRWLKNTPRTETNRAIFIPTDAQFGIEGRPQSATGQAAILTGRNVPSEIGEHYGPKPTPQIRDILAENNLFKSIIDNGGQAALINPFPPPFFKGINSGKRLPSSIQDAVLKAGISLMTEQDYFNHEAVSPDWTGEGWTHYLGYSDAPTYTPEESGALLGKLALKRDLTFFSTWITDEIGHRGPFERGVEFMQLFDRVMAGLLDIWNDDDGLIIITSDHGNMEVQGDRRHTQNQVPTVVIGNARHQFAENFSSLIDITPKTLQALGINHNHHT